MDPIVFDAQWWIGAVELPILGGLYWLIWRTRQEAHQALDATRQLSEAGDARLRENIADFKLEAAKTYASINSLSDVERRVVGHLLRIEAKLDRHIDARVREDAA
jgi:HAMP domain-containing protein